jgi:hypothetical protein
MRSTSDKKTSSNIKRPERPYVRPQLSWISLAACRGKDEIASGSDSGRRRWTRNAKADPTIGGEVITDVVNGRCVLKRPLVLQNSQN